jgi:membrane-bound hydrogenase subunit beta
MAPNSTASLKKTAMLYNELIDSLKAKFGDNILKLEVHEREAGLDGAIQSRDLWVEVTLPAFRPFIEHLFTYDFVNFHVLSGNDEGDAVTLNYHLSLFQRARDGRVGISLTVRLPKDSLTLPSIFDLLPGSEYSEREMREMLGVNFDGLPNKALVFLPEDWNEEIKPWRRDQAGPAPENIRELE